MTHRTDLEVPFSEKDEAKARGARWDAVTRTWFVPLGVDTTPFQTWIPETEDGLTKLLPPVFVVESSTACWKCGGRVKVGAIAASSFVESLDDSAAELDLYLFSGITYLPTDLAAAVRTLNPGYRLRYSKTAGMKYYMNHCICGAQLGDFFMYSEPGGAFFPVEAEDAKSMKLHRVSTTRPLEVAGDPGFVYPNLVLDHAVRV